MASLHASLDVKDFVDGCKKRKAGWLAQKSLQMWEVTQERGRASGITSVERSLRPGLHSGKIGIFTMILIASGNGLLLFSLGAARLFFILFGLLGAFAVTFGQSGFAWSRNKGLLFR